VKMLALALLATPAVTFAQSAPFKLVITWVDAGVVVVDYPSAARCDAARKAVQAEVDRRSRESAQALPPGAIVVGKSPNGAFCIPG
jgi:Skp family chaperone for outer membrane proteins